MTYEAVVDGRKARMAIESGKLRYEADPVVDTQYDIHAFGEGRYSVLLDGRSYTAVAIPGGGIAVNGRVYEVEVVDPRVFRARGAAGRAGGRQSIAAQMPGRVIRVLVEAGQDVEAGQGLIVVEAMKMQNEMRSPAAGKVMEVRIGTGQAVIAGQILMVID